MKKLLAYLLTITLLFGLSATIYAEPAVEAKTLPAIGEILYGFEMKEQGTLDLINAPTALFEHVKSGAQLFYIQSDDINRTFEITFRTPALDDTGAPHVFEHATLGGSEKYPHQNFFYSLISQTYTTFINAFTADTATSYPLSSLSEDQLFTLADVYMDGVFHPSIMTDERLFLREAWRYELADPEAEIAINGTVYSEMKGATTLDRAAQTNLRRGLYANSLIPNNSGGDPDHIPELTYQNLVDFHDQYYHPSNALIILYGDLDYERFMKHFDEEFLSNYDRAEIELPDYAAEPLDAPVDVTYEYPVEANSPAEDASTIQYGFALGQELTNKDKIALVLLSSMLNQENSPLMQLAREKLPGKTFYAGTDLFVPQPYFFFTATNVNESEKAVIKEIVEEGLKTIVEQGFDAETLEAVLASERFSILTIPESSGMGNSICTSMSIVWGVDGSLDYYNSYLEALTWLEGQTGDRLLEGFIETYLLDNSWQALVATVPVPGLAEEKAAALAERLAAYKASLTEEEILALVDQTTEMTAFSLEETPKELLASVQAVTVDSLPEEIEHYDVIDKTEDGVRYLTSEANVGGISLTNLLLDTSGFVQEDLHYLQLYAGLLGELDTEDYTKEALQTRMIRYLNGFATSPTVVDPNGETFDPVFSVQWMNLNGEFAEAINLVDKILYTTKFDDVQDMVNYVSRAKLALRNSIINAPYSVQMSRAFALHNEQYAYESYLSGLDYYQFLIATEKALEESPDAVIEKLRAVQQQMRNKTGAITIFAGNAEGIEEFETVIPDFFAALAEDPIEPADYSDIPVPAKREALVLDSNVQYNMIFAPLEEVGLEDSGKLDPLRAFLYSDYQMTKIRNDLGAYGILNSFTENGLLTVSYRDPNVAQTFEALEATGDFLRGVTASQDDLDRFIISEYSNYALPVGALNGALRTISRYLIGETDEDQLDRMREAKAFTLDDVHAAADAFDLWAEKGARSTSGSAAAIEAEADRYDNIIYLNEFDQ